MNGQIKKMNNITLGLTIAALVFFVILALMGSTVSAWHVVVWIIPTLMHH